MSLKILEVIPYLSPLRGGDVNVCYNEAKGLTKIGHSVDILTTDQDLDNTMVEDLRRGGVHVHIVPCRIDLASLLVSPKIKDWTRENLANYDMIHLHGFRTYQNIVVFKEARRLNRPYVLQPHGSTPRVVARRTLKLAFDIVYGYRILKHANRVIAGSEEEVEFDKKMGASPDRISVVYNAVDPTFSSNLPIQGRFKSAHGIENSKMILYLGRLHFSKGIDFLLKTFSMLSREMDQAVLVIVGPGERYKTTLAKLSQRLGIDSKVMLLGSVDEYEKKSAMVDCDLFAHTVRYMGGVGLAPLEATMCGAPIVVTEECSEVMRKGGFGYIVPFGDCENLKGTMEFALKNPEEARALARKGRCYILQNLSWESVVTEVATVYYQALMQPQERRTQTDSIGVRNAGNRESDRLEICVVEERFLSKRVAGPSRHMGYLADELSSLGYGVTVICAEQDSQSRNETSMENRRYETIPRKMFGRGFLTAIPAVMMLISRNKPDVIHAQGYRNLTTDLCAMAALLNHIPLVVTPRGSLLGYTHRESDSLNAIACRVYDTLTLKMSLRVASAIVVTSQEELNEGLRLGVPKRKLKLIPHGMKMLDPLPRKDNLEGNPKILTVSRITPHRNITAIIKGFKIVLEDFPEAVLYIAGDAIPSSHDRAERKYPSLVRDLIKTEDLDGKVIMLGGVYGDDLWRLYLSSDLFAYASSYDNFGFALLEAAVFGLPIVSTRVGIAEDLIQDNRNGVLIDDFEPVSVASAIHRMLTLSPSERKAMEERLKERASHYSIEENMKKHMELYENLVISNSHRMKATPRQAT